MSDQKNKQQPSSQGNDKNQNKSGQPQGSQQSGGQQAGGKQSGGQQGGDKQSADKQSGGQQGGGQQQMPHKGGMADTKREQPMGSDIENPDRDNEPDKKVTIDDDPEQTKKKVPNMHK